ncbi:MAG: hypothetical protein IJO56_07835 [Oscillospiraceae bacterium]|nr:hypothetical protein [Oscillospiraceae bacterium]
MVTGIDRFREWFRGYEDQYAIIGGTACDLLMSEDGMDFRATKDIDLVLIVEAITPDFGRQFWQFVKDAGYEHRNKSTGLPQFYRFSHPSAAGYPFMIELFSRRSEAIILPEDAVLTPLPMEDDVSSLSAILLDDDYYELVRSGSVVVDGVNVLDAAYLIPFKAKAWLDLTQKKASGQSVDSKNIRKHKNDVFRLSALLTQQSNVVVTESVLADLRAFLVAMQEETVDLKQLGVIRDKATIIADIMRIYSVK